MTALTDALAAQFVRIGYVAINVSDLERGIKEPRFMTLFRVAEALGVPPSRLFEPFDPKG